jgi:hypothetical protein
MGNFLGPEAVNSSAKLMHMGKVNGGLTLPFPCLIQLFNFLVTTTCSLLPFTSSTLSGVTVKVDGLFNLVVSYL